MATHSDVKSFLCSVCDKSFKTKKNLHCHLGTHQTIKPFKCLDCKKSFKTNRLLRFHAQTHKIKPAHFEEFTSEEDFKAEPFRIKKEVKQEVEEIEEVMKALGDHDEMGLTFGDENSDLSFFLSLLGDISKMNDQQKKLFRKCTLQTISDILF